jgi:glycosyltransferase
MRISIVTATYCCERTVADCLDSVAAQSHGDLQHVVIDGASSDGTLAVIERHRSRVHTLLSEPDGGIYDALNKGIARCDGDVIGFLHADDLYNDERVLEKVASVFADPRVEACYGDLVYVAATEPERIVRYWQSGDYSPSRLAWGWMPPHPAFFARRSAYARFGPFDTSLRIAADYDAMSGILLAAQGRVAYLPEVLVRMRTGGVSNRSLANILRKSAEDYRVIRRRHIGGIGTLLCKNLSKFGQFFARPPNTKRAS